MRKNAILFLAPVVFALSTHSFLFGGDVIKMKAASYLPATHPMSYLTGWFCDEVKNRTKGQVEITYMPEARFLIRSMSAMMDNKRNV